MIQLPICDIGNRVDPNWNTCVKVLGPNDVLPIPDHLDNLYLDFETTSEDPYKTSINPHAEEMLDGDMNLHRGCKICGVAFLFDNERIPYYIPVRHAYLDADGDYCYRTNDIPNVSIEKVHDWLKKILDIAKFWVNHNIKYDYHVLYNETGYRAKAKLIDTLILSKLAAIPEKFEYGLTTMMKVVGVDITPYELKIKEFLGKKFKDYGLIPPDQMATYAAVDVLAVRLLFGKLNELVPESCDRVMEMELDLLPTLIGIEQVGMRTDINKLASDWEELSAKQVKRIQRIKKYADFPGLQYDKKSSWYDLFVEHLGWDLDYTEKGEENIEKGIMTREDATRSFGASSIRKHIDKNPRVATSYIRYKDDEKLLTSYTMPYLETHINHMQLIHCNINQQVRTGRMSITQPGMQTLPKRAKEYIIPYTDDYALVEFDLSQIEFRVIVHYINNRAAIEKYNLDPTTDFHDWIASATGLDRGNAKTCNFLLGYGGGKNHFFDVMMEFFRKKGIRNESDIRDKADRIYKLYHSTLPELKPTSYRAGDVIKARGFVRTILNRERHIPRQFHYKAFNSVCQGTAADFQKYITAYRLKKFLGPDCLLHVLVHDSWLFSIRKNRLNELIPEIKYEIERPIEGINFSVPLISKFGISETNWRQCL